MSNLPTYRNPAPNATDTPRLPTGTDVVLAAQTLGNTIRHTPLEVSPRLSTLAQRTVYLKREDIQVGRSYKVRGAFNFISSLDKADAARGVVCASAGNHAQGVAFACNTLHIKGTIFIPTTTPRQKRHRIRDIGGEWIDLIEYGTTFDECARHATEFAVEHGGVYVHPFDDVRTIAGQGTVVKEIFEQASETPTSVVVPIGGGGLLAGTLAWVKQFHPDVKVIGVEPSGAASMKAAIEAGEPVTLTEVDSFADGTAVARAGNITFEMARQFCDAVVTVPEGAISSEMLDLYQVEGIITEPSGALSVAALRGYLDLEQLPPGPIAFVISGGNNDVLRYDDIVERSMIHEGLRHYFLVTFPQQPGALRLFLDEVLSDGEDIILFEYTKKNNRETGPALVGIEIDDPNNLDSLLKRMDASAIHTEKLEPNSPSFGFLL
ncbi:threonine dehydratase [Arcanobacterium pluranimalium]|uniref:threonine ammonia-lyase IlvA n=1 Tax=Arcanobacterium pluranimalium TaxID=108028 RepID=UPI001958795D|nr:threonine ammonia-lyase IlvA [Arcanobacterium pluranimalium]MBM7824481.1 threonine dehydratase [Arcanobacterium pluranimalium]